MKQAGCYSHLSLRGQLHVLFMSLGFWFLVAFALVMLLTFMYGYFISPTRTVLVGINHFGEADLELGLIFSALFFITYFLVGSVSHIHKNKESVA